MSAIYRIQKKAAYFAARLLPALRLLLENHARTHRLWRGRKKGRHTYTVVTCVHNNAQYLDAYFRSLTGQTLDFRGTVFLILVDDGSTDSSASIIRSWQARYPKNIRYIHQERQGRAEALNTGLGLVETPWVTFVEADDFPDATYFAQIDGILAEGNVSVAADSPVKMLVCCETAYDEKAPYVLRYWERVPGSLYVAGKNTIIPTRSGECPVPPWVRSVLFDAAELTKADIRFERALNHQIEDLLFSIRYLRNLAGGFVVISPWAKYYRRKKWSNNTAWDAAKNGDIDLTALEEGCARLFAEFGQRDDSPANPLLQSSLFTFFCGYIPALYNAPPPGGLNEEQTERFFSLLHKGFQPIEPQTLEAAAALTEGFTFPHMATALACFKGSTPSRQVGFITRYDHWKKQLCLVYYRKDALPEEVWLSGVPTPVVFSKNTMIRLGKRPCLLRRQIWVQLSSPEHSLEVFIAGCRAELELNGKGHSAISAGQAVASFGGSLTSPVVARTNAPWIFMDRPEQADDNAEHLYRYVSKTMPQRPVYYALQKTSPDWARLEAEGFQLLEPGSRKFDSTLREAEVLFSSHFELFQYSNTYFEGTTRKKQHIWLQHGVIIGNLSSWLNETDLDIIINSTFDEYHSIVDDNTTYNTSKREVKLTGLPRYDALVNYIERHKNSVFIMPTWRRYISKLMIETQFFNQKEQFIQSNYGMMWRKFLLSEELKSIHEKHASRITFFPHANLRPYLSYLSIPEYIKIASPTEGSIQNLLQEAVVLITDYSSIGFDMAFLQKTVLYYQFDQEDFISGHWEKGYFDYKKDGFGPVSTSTEELLHDLNALLERGGIPGPVYHERMKKAFPFRDGRNCERICQAVMERLS